MEQTKALNALEPFLALSKSATSPRAAIDLIRQATSAPNTFLFAELLQTQPIASLASSPDADAKAAHALLRIFSHGTYESYTSTPGLPSLSDAQTVKLRQLSLLSLARDRDNLAYGVLQQKLGLDTHREVEELVITAIYAGLINGTLDPARQTVQVTSIAPLRDLAPGAVPQLAATLKVWSERCTTTLGGLEAQITQIRQQAATRHAEENKAKAKLDKAISEVDEKDLAINRAQDAFLRPKNWQQRAQNMESQGGELMEVDEPLGMDDQQMRRSKRKW
ncbi:uncharacterized protein F5Z01DRAFT_651052 [Emericellopsis atlantica]|uniref:PCI domain-containing protein n=1 Tax=Emericellopsis atlantica TaxID=2614577 RepID=A0A9P8CST8_9HYPO|nr:uncharacterized protein F5Z01DRAFT_651052 [Emericellopsis atlantica]KAG9256096.1 hypothetical protein F5Z01DRAFT_651052 [Emericellopsis atlantica]